MERELCNSDCRFFGQKRAVLYFVLIASHAWALDCDRLMTQYVHRCFLVEHGLPQSNVTAVAQTKDGYLWVGTQEGVARFDGVRFEIHDRRVTLGFTENLITALTTDGNGSILVGTFGGGVLYPGQSSWKEVVEPSKVKALTVDDSGRIWVGTLDEGIIVQDGTKKTVVGLAQGLSHQTITALAQVPDSGTMWVGTRAGLNRIQGRDNEVYNGGHGLLSSSVLSILIDRDKRLWVGTTEGVLVRDLGSTEFRTIPWLESVGRLVVAMCQDVDGNIWIGTDHGLARFRQDGLQCFPDDHVLGRAAIECLFEDRERNLWVGTVSDGLHQLRDGTFTSISPDDGLPGEYVLSLAETEPGTIYMGTRGQGLIQMDAAGFKQFTQTDGLPHNVVKALCKDDRARLWVGTPRGLVYLKDGQIHPCEEQIPGVVSALMWDLAGSLWIGTFGGLYRLDDKGLHTMDPIGDGQRCIVLGLLQDANGRIWVGTDGDGIRLFDGDAFRGFTKADGLSDNVIWSIVEDRQNENVIWFTTYAGGLIQHRDGRFRCIGMQQGLFDDLVIHVLEDDQGRFWCSCNKGVFRVDKAAIDAVFRGESQGVECDVFGTDDGMKSRECNGGNQHSGLRSHAGSLWFPTTRGVAKVHPGSVQPNEVKPPVHIESLVVNGETNPVGQHVNLEPNDENIEFHYTATSLGNPNRVQFRYRMQGVDRNWIEAGTRRVAYYNHLPAGERVFQVVACNEDGLWNECGARIEDHSAPPIFTKPRSFSFV